MYKEIAGMNAGKRISANNAFFAGFINPADIDYEERKFITTVAEQRESELPDNFFGLGNLDKDPLYSDQAGGKLQITEQNSAKTNSGLRTLPHAERFREYFSRSKTHRSQTKMPAEIAIITNTKVLYLRTSLAGICSTIIRQAVSPNSFKSTE